MEPIDGPLKKKVMCISSSYRSENSRLNGVIVNMEEIKTPLPNVSTQKQLIRSYPRAIVLLCLTVSLTNLFIAPAVIYFILRSRRSWAKCRYSRTYRHVNKAACLAITGLVISGILLLIVVLFFGIIPVNGKNSNTFMSSAVNATADTPEVVLNETAETETFEKIKVVCNTNHTLMEIGHMGNVSSRDLYRKNITVKYSNDTHTFLTDEKKDWILEIPKEFRTKRSTDEAL